MNDRLKLGVVGDDYVLGAVCKKLGLVKYAISNLIGMTRNASRLELFYRGVEDAAGCDLSDLARDFWKIRRTRPIIFDMMVRGTIGNEEHAKVIEVIERRESYVSVSPMIEEFFKGMESNLGIDGITTY